MMIDKMQYDALSKKAVKVISPEVIRSMSAAQRGLLNQALGRVLAKRGSVASNDARNSGTSWFPFGNFQIHLRRYLPTPYHLIWGASFWGRPFRPGFPWATMRLIRHMGWGFTPSRWHAWFKG